MEGASPGADESPALVLFEMDAVTEIKELPKEKRSLPTSRFGSASHRREAMAEE